MRTFRKLIWVCIIFCSVHSVFTQEKSEVLVLKKNFEIKKHTVLERFEPEYVVSTQKRVEMKEKRIANTAYTRSVLDTMKISNRKRKQLLQDLKYNPFSKRLNKFIVDSKFEDENLVSEQK